MTDRPFMDAGAEPTEANLETAMAVAYPRYRDLLELAGGYSRSWGYGKAGGWMLKVFARGKALFYVIPLRGGFKVSLTVREAEREAMLADAELSAMRAALAGAKKYPEGFALAFEVAETAECPELEPFMRKLVALRQGGG
jgi:uncharacterized protein DUF3788